MGSGHPSDLVGSGPTHCTLACPAGHTCSPSLDCRPWLLLLLPLETSSLTRLLFQGQAHQVILLLGSPAREAPSLLSLPTAFRAFFMPLFACLVVQSSICSSIHPSIQRYGGPALCQGPGKLEERPVPCLEELTFQLASGGFGQQS